MHNKKRFALAAFTLAISSAAVMAADENVIN